MRHFAMTGISTAAMISRITFGEAMRATPPSARICAGTRSRAMTATAPARSAISACFAVVTSMMTPPLSISARPVFRRRLVLCPLFCDMGLLSSAIVKDSDEIAGAPKRNQEGRAGTSALPASVLILQPVGNSRYPYQQHVATGAPAVLASAARLGIRSCMLAGKNGGASPRGQPRAAVPTWALSVDKQGEHFLRIDRHEQMLAACQDFVFFVQDFSHVSVLPALDLHLARFHPQWLPQRHRFQVVHGNFGSDSHYVTQHVHFAHGFIEDGCDDAAVAVSGRSGVALA